jgi:hypothetical protein
MRVSWLALALGGLMAAAPPARAQQPPSSPEPSEAQRQAAVAEIAQVKGIGGCILNEMDGDLRTASLTHFGLGKPGMPPEFETGVARAAPRCTSRPFSASDRALANAALGTFKRAAIAVYFATEFAIGQHRLDEVWKRAPDREKAPFVEAAKSMMDPKLTTRAPTLDETKPLAARLGIVTNEPGLLAPVHQYFLATALSELAEKELSREGVREPH